MYLSSLSRSPVGPPYARRPAGKPLVSTKKPGSKVRTKPSTSLDTFDWRNEIAADAYPRSLPINASNRITMVDKACARLRPGSLEDQSKEGVREVDLEGLIHDGKGKREKRATTATTLGFDFIPNPCITALPDSFEVRPQPIRASPHVEGDTISLEATPRTPGFLHERSQTEEDEENEDEEEDEWERISMLSSTNGATPLKATGFDEDEEVIIVGELELDDVPVVKAKGKQGAKGVGRISYAAVLGKQA